MAKNTNLMTGIWRIFSNELYDNTEKLIADSYQGLTN